MKYNSVYDNKGRLYVDCTECNRGYYGDDSDECSCGFKIKKPNNGGCFIGDILPSIPLDQLKRLV